MMFDPEEHQAYDEFASFYDPAHLNREPEITFYRSLLRTTDRALVELGCGTGRIIAAIARELIDRQTSGVRAVGVDLSQEMIRIARTRYPWMEWVQGDLADPPLEGCFDIAICPFNTLQILPSREHVERALRRATTLLNPGGKFAFDVYNASYREPNQGVSPADRIGRIVRRFKDASGRDVVVREEAFDDPAGQFVRLNWSVLQASDLERSTLARLDICLRHYTPEEIEELLDQSGLEILERYGDVQKSPFTVSGSMKQVVICTPKFGQPVNE
jgi:SAM-dependent methyltransferase